MAKTVAFDVEVDSGNSVKTLGSLKEQLAQINEELEQVEIGSKAFTELSDQARSTASEIKTLEKTFEGLEPQQKTEAFLKGFEAISGAVAVTAGTLAVFGVESDKIGKIEEKVQGAIAIAIGARAIAEGALQARIAARLVAEKAAAVATKAATVAQAAFNLVLNANPIFLLVTVLAAVTAGIVAFTAAMGDNTEEVEENNKALLRRNQLLEDSANFQLRVAQATGRSAEEVKQSQIEVTEATIARLEAEYRLAEAGEAQKKLAEDIRKANDDLIIQNLELGRIREDARQKEIKDAEDRRKRLAEERKKEQDERDRIRKEELKKEEDFQQKFFNLRVQAFKKSQQELNDFLLNIDREEEERLKRSKERSDAFFKDRVTVQRASTIQSVNDTQEQTRTSLDTIASYAENLDLRVKAFIQGSVGQTIQGVAQLGNQLFTTLRGTLDESNKEGFEKSKKYKIGQVITTSTQASFEAFASAQKLNGTVPGLGTIIGAALVAAIIASSKKAITDIQNSKFDGGGSSKSPIAGGGGGGFSNAAGSFIPIGQQPAGTQLTPTFQAPAPQPIPAYVIAGDVENGLEAEARLRNRRRLGPG
jgi:hypothetical protein